MASMYELSAGYKSLIDHYEMAETDEERGEILGMLAATREDIADKAEAYARIIRNAQSDIDGFKAEIDRLTKRRRAVENMVAWLKETLMTAMAETGETEIRTSIGKWRLQDNPWSCEVVDIDAVPMQYHIKQEDKIDRKGILEQFRLTGEIVGGVEIERKPGIRFR